MLHRIVAFLFGFVGLLGGALLGGLGLGFVCFCLLLVEVVFALLDGLQALFCARLCQRALGSLYLRPGDGLHLSSGVLAHFSNGITILLGDHQGLLKLGLHGYVHDVRLKDHGVAPWVKGAGRVHERRRAFRDSGLPF